MTIRTKYMTVIIHQLYNVTLKFHEIYIYPQMVGVNYTERSFIICIYRHVLLRLSYRLWEGRDL